MSQQSTNRRQFREIEKLTTGDHVNHQVHQDDEVFTWQVGHVAPYTDPDRVPMVALMLAPVGGGEPQLVRERRGVTLPLATEKEIAAAKAEGTRFALADGLHELARRVLNDRLPVPGFISFSGVADSREQLDTWAKAFGAEVRMSGRYPVASWELGGLDVRLQGEEEPVPVEPAQEWLFTFGSGQQHDGRFVRITGTHASARARMLEVFGTAWCDQYDWRRFDELGLPAVLTELPESEWPTPAVACPCLEPSDSEVLADVPAQRSGE